MLPDVKRVSSPAAGTGGAFREAAPAPDPDLDTGGGTLTPLPALLLPLTMAEPSDAADGPDEVVCIAGVFAVAGGFLDDEDVGVTLDGGLDAAVAAEGLAPGSDGDGVADFGTDE